MAFGKLGGRDGDLQRVRAAEIARLDFDRLKRGNVGGLDEIGILFQVLLITGHVCFDIVDAHDGDHVGVERLAALAHAEHHRHAVDLFHRLERELGQALDFVVAQAVDFGRCFHHFDRKLAHGIPQRAGDDSAAGHDKGPIGKSVQEVLLGRTHLGEILGPLSVGNQRGAAGDADRILLVDAEADRWAETSRAAA